MIIGSFFIVVAVIMGLSLAAWSDKIHNRPYVEITTIPMVNGDEMIKDVLIKEWLKAHPEYMLVSETPNGYSWIVRNISKPTKEQTDE